MGDQKLAKRVEGKRIRGRPKLRWGIALSDLERMGEELGKRANDRRNVRLLIQNVVRGRKKAMDTEIMINSPLTTVMPRKEQQQNAT